MLAIFSIKLITKIDELQVPKFYKWPSILQVLFSKSRKNQEQIQSRPLVPFYPYILILKTICVGLNPVFLNQVSSLPGSGFGFQ